MYTNKKNVFLCGRNGKEKVDLDLIVLDKDHHDCNMYAKGDKQCSCTHSYTG